MRGPSPRSKLPSSTKSANRNPQIVDEILKSVANPNRAGSGTRFNEGYIKPKSTAAPPRMAFGSKAVKGGESGGALPPRSNRPPLHKATTVVEGFEKKEWTK